MQGEQTDKDGRMSHHQQQHQGRGNNDVEKALSSPGGVRTSSGDSSGGGNGEKERKYLSSQQGTGKLSVVVSDVIRPGGFTNNGEQKANGRNEDDNSESKKRHSERIRIVPFISKALSHIKSTYIRLFC